MSSSVSSATLADTPPRRPQYRDGWVRLVGIPLLTGLGYYLTYSNPHFNWLFVYELFSDALKILVVWQLVRATIRWLDGRVPWHRGAVRRLARQVPLTCLVGMGVLTGLVELEYAWVRPYPLDHYWSLDLVIAFVFLLLVNTIYTGLYYYDQYQLNHSLYRQSEAEKHSLAAQLQAPAAPLAGPEPVPAAAEQPAHLLVKVGRRELVVPFADIRCCYSVDKETYLLTTADKQFLLDYSLDRLLEQLPPAKFFRANRQFVLTPGAVQLVQPDTHGKLLVHLLPSPRLPAQLVVSRERAAAFRHWLRNGSPAGRPGASSPIP